MIVSDKTRKAIETFIAGNGLLKGIFAENARLRAEGKLDDSLPPEHCKGMNHTQMAGYMQAVSDDTDDSSALRQATYAKLHDKVGDLHDDTLNSTLTQFGEVHNADAGSNKGTRDKDALFTDRLSPPQR